MKKLFFVSISRLLLIKELKSTNGIVENRIILKQSILIFEVSSIYTDNDQLKQSKYCVFLDKIKLYLPKFKKNTSAI